MLRASVGAAVIGAEPHQLPRNRQPAGPGRLATAVPQPLVAHTASPIPTMRELTAERRNRTASSPGIVAALSGYPGGMGASFHLGRIAGVRIGVHWSVLVIFALIAWSLAGWRFPAMYPQYSTGAYVAAGLLTAVVFLACLLAHELSHAMVARRNGLAVPDITLWLFGGVTRLSGEARNPGAELRIAGVGPLVSLLLGVVFFGVAVLLAAGRQVGLALAAFAWLGGINVALAVFNVIPAAPLDGGRLLRSAIWWRTGDRLKATVWSSRAGQFFGWILVGLGLFAFLTGRGWSGLWFALIGWFLIGAATAERRVATFRGQLGEPDHPGAHDGEPGERPGVDDGRGTTPQ